MTRGLTLLFAVAGGAAVGNLYWAQPLLDFIARDLHASTATAGWLVTATQVGYAAGIVLVVPLGDVLVRRRLIPVIMTCAAVALVGCALAPSFAVLLLAITALGLTTVAGRERAVRWTMVLGGTAFGVFTLFWTALTFLLSGPPFSYPVSVIGLFGLAGLAGAITAQRAGRFHDRGWSLPVTGGAYTLAIVAFVVAGLAGHTVAGVLVAVVLRTARSRLKLFATTK